jgi:hypothetical protein
MKPAALMSRRLDNDLANRDGRCRLVDPLISPRLLIGVP